MPMAAFLAAVAVERRLAADGIQADIDVMIRTDADIAAARPGGLAGFPALEPFALALTEEPRLPVALAQALLPENDVVVIMIVDEPLLAVAQLDTREPTVALPAPTTKGRNRQGDMRRNETFIDTSLHHSTSMTADTAVAKKSAVGCGVHYVGIAASAVNKP